MNCFQYILDHHKVCTFQSNEGDKWGPASNSEIRRWFKQKCIEINFESVQAEDPLPLIIKSVVMFPNNKRKRCTFYYDDSITLIQIDETKLEKEIV